MNDKAPTLFDAAGKFGVRNPLSGEKYILRFPTDEEWIEYSRRIVFEVDGSGRLDPVSDGSQEAAELARQLVDGNREVAEAEFVLERLVRCEVVDIQSAGRQMSVHCVLHGGLRGTATFETPNISVVSNYWVNSFASVAAGAKRQRWIKIDYQAELYDKHIKEVVGWAGRVPACHKAKLISAAIDHAATLISDDSNDFFPGGSGQESPAPEASVGT